MATGNGTGTRTCDWGFIVDGDEPDVVVGPTKLVLLLLLLLAGLQGWYIATPFGPGLKHNGFIGFDATRLTTGALVNERNDAGLIFFFQIKLKIFSRINLLCLKKKKKKKVTILLRIDFGWVIAV